jgi:hypothetical protein
LHLTAKQGLQWFDRFVLFLIVSHLIITSILASRYKSALHIFRATGSSDTGRTILCATGFCDDGCNLYYNRILSISRWPS